MAKTILEFRVTENNASYYISAGMRSRHCTWWKGWLNYQQVYNSFELNCDWDTSPGCTATNKYLWQYMSCNQVNNSSDLANIHPKGVYDLILHHLHTSRSSIFSILVPILIKGIGILGEACLTCENVYWDSVSSIGSFTVYLCTILNTFYRSFITSHL